MNMTATSIATAGIETFKGADGYYAVNMPQLTAAQATQVRELAATGQLSEQSLLDLLGSADSFASVGADDVWLLPDNLRVALTGSDGEINPAFLSMLCMQLLQDNQQELRKTFLKEMFEKQDRIMAAAAEEKFAAEQSAHAAYSSAITSAAVGMVGGVAQVGGGVHGATSLYKVNGTAEKIRDLQADRQSIEASMDANKVQSPDEKAAALGKETSLRSGDTVKAHEFEIAGQKAEAERLQRLAYDTDRLKKNDERISQLNHKVSVKTEAAGISARAGAGLNTMFGQVGQAAGASSDREAKLHTAMAQYLSTVGSTERANYEFDNNLAGNANSNYSHAGDIVSAIISSAASTSQATAARMA